MLKSSLTNLYDGAHPTIRVDVGYYNDTHRSKLLALDNASDIAKLVANPIEIDTPNFLAYYLFHLQPGRPEYATYQGCMHNSFKSKAETCDLIQHNGLSLQLPNTASLPVYVTEHFGEAIGLSVISRLYGLHEADWQKIDERRGPRGIRTLDYKYNFVASNKSTLVELETKGSKQDTNIATNGLNVHATRIKEKKDAQRNSDVSAPTVRYGTISVIDARDNSIVQCWLLDPPPISNQLNPRSFRLLSRMEFISTWISFVSSRSQLAATMATRVYDLAQLGDPFELDRARLRNGRGEPIAYPLVDATHSAFFNNRCRVVGEPAGGVVVPWSRDEVAFIGFDEIIISLATEQNFESILDYRVEPRQVVTDVQCYVSENNFKALELDNYVNSTRDSTNHYSFTLSGVLNFSEGGLVFGVLSKSSVTVTD